jgi:hypothetical protein
MRLREESKQLVSPAGFWLANFDNGWLGCGVFFLGLVLICLLWLGLARFFKWPLLRYQQAVSPDTKPEPPAV